MEGEVRAAPPSYRNAISTKLRVCRRDLAKLQRDMKSSASGFPHFASEGSRHGAYSAQSQPSVSLPLTSRAVRPVDCMKLLHACTLGYMTCMT